MLTRFTRGPLRGPRAWKQFRSSRARMNRRVKRPFRQSGVGKRTVAAGYTGERRTIAYRGQTTTAYRRGGETEERLAAARWPGILRGIAGGSAVSHREGSAGPGLGESPRRLLR